MHQKLILVLITALSVVLGCFAQANQTVAQESWIYYQTAQTASQTTGAGGGISTALEAYKWHHPAANLPSCWVEGSKATCEGAGNLVNVHGYALLRCQSPYIEHEGKCVGPRPVANPGCEGSYGADGALEGGPFTPNGIEISTGRKVESQVDWTTGGERALHFTRFYSSQNLRALSPDASMLGTGWRSNFDMRAFYATSTRSETTIANAATMHFALPNGMEISFRKVSGNWVVSYPVFTGTSITWSTRTDIDASLTTTATSVVLRLPGAETFTFDEKGALTQKTIADGYSHHLYYSADGVLSRVVDSFGRALTFSYHEFGANAGLLLSFTTPDAKTHKFTYIDRIVQPPAADWPSGFDVVGNSALASVIYPDATPATDADNPRKTFGYLQDHRHPFALTSITDEAGNALLSVIYDVGTGRATQAELNGGVERYAVAYDETNNKATVSNNLGASTDYNYEAAFGAGRRITSVTGLATPNSAASTMSCTFDANGFPNQVTDGEGRILQITSNSRGLPTSIVSGAGTASPLTITPTWDATKPILQSVGLPSLTTNTAYNANDLVSSVTESDVTTTTVPYSTNGQQRVTTYGYQSFMQAQPAALTPPGTALSDVGLTITNANGQAMTGWTTVSGAMTSGTASPCSAADPCFYANSSSDIIVQQDVAIPAGETANVDAGNRAAKISWKQFGQSIQGRSGLRLVFLNASGTVIGSLATPLPRLTTTATRERIGPVPTLTRTIRVQMLVSSTYARLDTIALTLTANGTATATPFLTLANPDALATGTPGWTVSSGTVVNTAARRKRR